MDKLRDYGLGDSGKPLETPTWSIPIDAPPCPNCGAELCAVKVLVEQPLLKGGKGIANYLGCPACAFASPAMVMAITNDERR